MSVCVCVCVCWYWPCSHRAHSPLISSSHFHSGSYILPQRWHLEAGITAPRFRPHPHTGSQVRGRGGDDGPLSVFEEWNHSKLNRSIFESRINPANLLFLIKIEQWRSCSDLTCSNVSVVLLQMPNQFEQSVVLNQLRYSGMLETVKIRRSGFPVRRTFKDFCSRFVP